RDGNGVRVTLLCGVDADSMRAVRRATDGGMAHVPLLFCVDADLKSSSAVAYALLHDSMHGEGDLLRHVGFMGYKLTEAQGRELEYDYSVTSLALDMRDGARLCKMVEVLSKDASSVRQRQIPATCHALKLHNNKVALAAMSAAGLPLCEGPELEAYATKAADLVSGHREKTLGILWKMMWHWQLPQLLDLDELRAEIAQLEQGSPQQCPPLTEMETRLDTYMDSEILTLLLWWSQAVVARYDARVVNFTSSLADGRVLCLLLHYYLGEAVVHQEDIRGPMSSGALSAEEAFGNGPHEESDTESECDLPWTAKFNMAALPPEEQEALKARRDHNFQLLHTCLRYLGGVPELLHTDDLDHTTPDEKVGICMMAFLCARLLDQQREVQAVVRIQRMWRNYHQGGPGACLTRWKAAIAVVGKVWGVYHGGCEQRSRALKKKAAKMKKARNYAAVLIQAAQRGRAARQLCMTMQGQRAGVRMHLARARFQKLRMAAVGIQAAQRGRAARQLRMTMLEQRARAATHVQAGAGVRMHLARARFQKLRMAAVGIRAGRSARGVLRGSCANSDAGGPVVRARPTCRLGVRMPGSNPLQKLRISSGQASEAAPTRACREAAAHDDAEAEARAATHVQAEAGVRMHLARTLPEAADGGGYQRRGAAQACRGQLRMTMQGQGGGLQHVQAGLWLSSSKQYPAALRIQAHWRGHLTRCHRSFSRPRADALRQLRARLREATRRARADVTLQLGYRTRSALTILLRSRKVTEVLNACAALDSATEHSLVCCALVTDRSAVPILLKFLGTCNRSKPHLQLLRHGLRIIEHVCSRPRLISHVALCPDIVDGLLNLLQMYRDIDDVFSIAAGVLHRVCMHPSVNIKKGQAKIILKRLESLTTLFNRKVELERKHVGSSHHMGKEANGRLASVSHQLDVLSSIIFQVMKMG
ncbi:hypothetical protein CYMTET_49902, partial [Cymbomonas tetramitiformis]